MSALPWTRMTFLPSLSSSAMRLSMSAGKRRMDINCESGPEGPFDHFLPVRVWTYLFWPRPVMSTSELYSLTVIRIAARANTAM